MGVGNPRFLLLLTCVAHLFGNLWGWSPACAAKDGISAFGAWEKVASACVELRDWRRNGTASLILEPFASAHLHLYCINRVSYNGTRIFRALLLSSGP